MRFLRFQLKFRHAVSHFQCSKICPSLTKLPKFAQRQNFEISPIIEILVFFKKIKILCVKEALEHVFTIGFSIQEFFICYFIVKNWPLYVNFSIPLCAK
jgi:hypothetical protein